MSLQLNKQCVTFSKIILRHFRTQSASLYPRGVAINERRRVFKQDIENEVREELETRPPTDERGDSKPENSLHSTHKDIRSIDEVDHVILKYVSFLDNMDNNSESRQEKVHATDFGSIRFDNDNIPNIHGQFDSMVEHDINSTSDVSLKSGVQFRNYLDYDVKDKNPGHHIEANAYRPGSLPYDNEDKKDKPMSEGERAFEELFWNDRNDDNDFVAFTKTSDLNRDAPNEKNIGYIDEQFWGDCVTQHSKDNAGRSPAKQHSSYQSKSSNLVKDVDTRDKLSPLDGVKDLNFIDQTFFGSSIDVLKENRNPTIEYSEIKEDIEKIFDGLSVSSANEDEEISDITQEDQSFTDMKHVKEQHNFNIALEYLGIDPSTVSPSKIDAQEKEKEKLSPPIKESPPKSAYDYVLKKRRELHDSQFAVDGEGEKPMNSSYLKILSLVRQIKRKDYTKQEVLSLLKESILYNNHDIVGLYKPYGLAMHEGAEGHHHILTEFLPALAKYLKTEDLFPVHRLDTTTSGILLLARTQTMADTLKEMFKKQEIKKTYWAITKGIPKLLQGLIEIPIAEGKVSGKHRMVLRPDVDGLRGSQHKSQMGITEYKVLSSCYNAALVEVKPRTGIKHQVRVHLGFGLSCPILGDHKYSHLKKLAPQKLPGDMLDHLKIKQSRVRDLPMYLHSRTILIPEINYGRNIFIQANIPAFFNKTIGILKLNRHKNKVRYDGTRVID